MRSMLQVLKAIFVGGVIFLIPVVLTIVIIRHALALAGRALQPVAQVLPAQVIGGVFVADLLAILVLLLICFAAGLFVKTRLGRSLGDQLERTAARRIPGFSLVKVATRGMMGLESSAELSVALARIEDAWMLSFVVERHASGLYTVFVPSAPTPAAGSVYYLTEDRLKFLNVSVASAVSCIMRLGVGSRELIEGKSGPAPGVTPAAAAAR